MELSEILVIIAIISGPLAVFFLEKYWRRKEWKRRRKEEVVYNLVGARGGTRTPLHAKELEKALNSIPIIFSDKDEIIEAYNEFYEVRNQGNSNLATEKLVKLILKICREMGFEDIEKSTVRKILTLHTEKFS